jgi:hypothetical protein
MAAILLLVVILGLLVAGRAQALAADDGSALRLQVWQLGLGAGVMLAVAAHVTLGTPLPVASGGYSMVKGIGLVAVLAFLGLALLRTRGGNTEEF